MSTALPIARLGLALLTVFFAIQAQALAEENHSGPSSVREALAPQERVLWQVLEALHVGDRIRALQLADALAEQTADFALLEALGDALRAAATPEKLQRLREQWLFTQGDTLGSAAAPPAGSLLPLWQESAQRWRHRGYPVPQALPFVLALDRRVGHLIVVETSTSRLFLFRNDPEGLLLERDFYATIGRQGAGKEVEGDERTPLGVYFTLSRMDEEGLAERYGAHAFPLDYPNAWDRRLERTGRGIWIHGVPPQTYSRPPLASDGCVALTNPDIQWMAKRLAPRRTPVVITEVVPWAGLSPGLSASHGARLRARIGDWLDAWGAGDDVALGRFYASGVAPSQRARAPLALTPERLVLIQDPNQPAQVVASFGDGKGGWYRQHWRQEDGEGVWRVVAERIRPPRP